MISELFGKGMYPLIDEAVEIIKRDAQLVNELGGSLAVFGASDGRRRRPIIHKHLGPDGRQVIEAQFFVEGNAQRGRVVLKATETEDGCWKKEMLVVDIPGHPTHYLIKPAPITLISNNRSGWRPFSKWF